MFNEAAAPIYSDLGVGCQCILYRKLIVFRRCCTTVADVSADSKFTVIPLLTVDYDRYLY